MKANITELPQVQEIYPDKIIILGTEIEADFCDADVYDQFEALRKGLEKYKPTATADAGKAIREQCELVFECFDILFGDGTAQKIFGNRTNLRICLQAFIELSRQANGQLATVKQMVDSNQGNREQRRLVLNG